MSNVNTVAFVAAMNASTEAPKVEAPNAYGSKLDAAKKTTEEKDREKKQVARARERLEERLDGAYAKGETMTLGAAIDLFMKSADNEIMSGKIAIAAITTVLGYEGWADMTAATSTGNLRGVWERREEIRKGIARKAFLAGHANKDSRWSRLCKIMREHLGSRGTREPKPIATVAKATLISLYRKYLKVENPSEAEMVIGLKLADILTVDFKFDLSNVEK